ncbi:MAG: hypothetical protein M4579_005080, partial [Chaenotheca gracillima]
MPISHLCLPVSSLPASCSFFATALQPLGYTFLRQHEDRFGFGLRTPDFYLCQDKTGSKSTGPTHIALSTPQPSQVRAFYKAALAAGGQPFKDYQPTFRNEAEGYYSAAVLDLDHNIIEVVARCSCNEESMSQHIHGDNLVVRRRSVAPSTTSKEDSRVLGWQKDVAESLSGASAPRSTAPAARSTTSTRRESTNPPIVLVEEGSSPPTYRTTGDVSTKALVGTLLGAAGGAAVAYAMMKAQSQDEGARAAREPPRASVRVFQAPPSRLEPRNYRQVTPSETSTSATQRGPVHAIEAPPAAARPRSTLISTFVTNAASPPSRAPQPNEDIATPLPRLLEAPRHSSRSSHHSRPGFAAPSHHSRGSASPRSAREVPLPTTRAAPSQHSRTSNRSARHVPLPASTVRSTRVSAREIPLPASRNASQLTLADTVIPEDSISCA